ncbi:MAG TPA: dephospho-CoA kinase [Actinomycetota bacterium]|nr:dephospho-CoA kinase [Actinomycetota bacterium]
MLLVGLTGGLASGKSTVARMLARRGAIIVDADELSRQAVAPGTPGLGQIVEAFGRQVLDPSGGLDRSALADIVFADETKRRILESIVHPEVFRLLGEVVDRHRDTDAIVVFDAPLIVETGFDQACDVVVVVSSPPEAQVARVARTRGMSEEDARSRIASQTSPAHRESRADVVIQNGGTIEDLEGQAATLWEDLRARAAGSRT